MAVQNIFMSLISLEAVEKLAKKAGVSNMTSDAVKELENLVEEIGTELAMEAAEIAKNAKRKKIEHEDIIALRKG